MRALNGSESSGAEVDERANAVAKPPQVSRRDGAVASSELIVASECSEE